MIAVITPSIRKDGLMLVKDALSGQSFRDFKWFIGSPFDPEIKDAEWVVDDFSGGFWTLNRIWNKLYESASDYKLIVHWQDWIWAPPDALQKFFDNHQAGRLVVSGVGDQYESVDEMGTPQVKIWSDPRKTAKYGSLYECVFNDIEYNFCAIDNDLIKRYGGADEGLDYLGFGGDLYQLSDRMNDGGEHFWLDQSNESYTVRHGREYKLWDKNHILFNGRYLERKKELILEGNWPILKKHLTKLIK